jgi:hypothetical protein
MGAAAYRRGSKNISRQIDTDQRASYTERGGALGEVRRMWRDEQKALLATIERKDAEMVALQAELQRAKAAFDRQCLVADMERRAREDIQAETQQRVAVEHAIALEWMRRAENYRRDWKYAAIVLRCVYTEDRQRAEEEARAYYPQVFED